jgi:prepilin-type processing-associated H-X9-DG protein
MTDDERLKKSAWRWPQLIAILVIVVVVIGMLLPVLHMSDDGLRNRAFCGKNQSQILGAFIANATDEDVTSPWPVIPISGTVIDARSARVVTSQMFGMISRSQSLPLGLFSCPQSKYPRMQKFDGAGAPITWDVESGSRFYALDWSSPDDPGSSRVVMADRDPTSHKNKVMATFGDGHVKSIKISTDISRRSKDVLITEGPDGKSISVSSIDSISSYAPPAQPDLLPDDIYTNEGDSDNGSQPLVPAKGNPTRTWVK